VTEPNEWTRCPCCQGSGRDPADARKRCPSTTAGIIKARQCDKPEGHHGGHLSSDGKTTVGWSDASRA
jgi:hypothetical protein